MRRTSRAIERAVSRRHNSPDLRATNEEIRHEDRGYQRRRPDRKNLVNNLRERGHEVVAGSPSSGVNAVTGEGLAIALAGAQGVVDEANSPSFEDRAVLEFFETSSRNLLAAEAAAGVGHHVALLVVGADRLPDSGYMRAKVAQEKLIKGPGYAIRSSARRS